MIVNAIGHEQLSYFIIIHFQKKTEKNPGNIKLECWSRKASTAYNYICTSIMWYTGTHSWKKEGGI